MSSQFAFAGGGMAGIGDGHGVVWADVAGTGAALELFADAAGAGTPAGAVNPPGLGDLSAADAAQLAAGRLVLLAAVSMALMCGALSIAIPATSATVRSPIIETRCARGRSGKSWYLRASRRRYDRTLR